MKKKNHISKLDLHNAEIARVRKQQKDDGMFDGRFNTRMEKDASKYSRKQKHKRN